MPKLPLVGEVKPAYLYAGGAAMAGVVFYAYWKRRSSAGVPAATSSIGTDATIDPATGMPYADETGVYGSSYGGVDPATGIPFIYEGGSGNPSTTSAYTSNQQWSQAAIGELENTFGYAASLSSASVRDYLAGKALPPDEYAAMQLIIAELGPPPTGTFNLVQGPATGSGSGSTSGKLVPGEELRIPYNVAPGQASRVAAKFGISLAHLLQENPGKTGKETVTTGYVIPYAVGPTTTLESLARDFGISVEHLLQYIP